MDRRQTLFRSSRFSIVMLVGICTLILGTGWINRRGPNRLPTQKRPPRLQNKTNSFEVVQIKTENDGVELALKNGYTKNITAYAISVNRLLSQVDFLYSEREEDQRGIAPGFVYTTNAGIDRSSNRDVAAQEGIDIRVLAVVFDDRTGDGDPKSVAEILEMREGSKKQLARIIGVVNEVLNSTATVDDGTIDQLISQISSLPTESVGSIAKSTGLRGEKDGALQRLDSLANSKSQPAGEMISRFRVACEKLLARL